MEKRNEYERRWTAIQLLRKGTRFKTVCRAVGRSEFWLAKWWGRYQREG